MTIVVTGGGSGGHITPILAVAAELKKLRPNARIIYIGQTGDGLSDIPAQDQNIDEVFSVRAGKLRRYNGLGWRQIFKLKTQALNLRDAIYILIGLVQSFWLLKRLNPEVVFIKGGFVGVPVGLSAAVLRIPYVTHDSDALPGLANRIIARWASLHAVALPKEVYGYPTSKTVTVGVPISDNFYPLSGDEIKQYRQKLGLDPDHKFIFLTGGGLGAQRVNEALLACLPELLRRYQDLRVALLVGRNNEIAVRAASQHGLTPKEHQRVSVMGFTTDLYLYSGAADVVITRAGATSVAEFAAQAKACVVVPNPYLTGGHQLKNAEILAERKAVRMVYESTLEQDPKALMPALTELLDNPAKSRALGQKLANFSRPDSAHRLAMLLLEQAKVAT
jgi:UDP-N-acetylglucosamine--N-acetylmuramyl-(pentapeptide) pyrophosphoryl-undecaprenol N-acetylglucosamine transferase